MLEYQITSRQIFYQTFASKDKENGQVTSTTRKMNNLLKVLMGFTCRGSHQAEEKAFEPTLE